MAIQSFSLSRKLAGNRPDYGEGLYSGQSKLAEQGNAGQAFGPKGPLGKRTGCIWTTWARTPSTVCWPHCGASCSAMTILPRSTVRTMAGTACRPAKARADFDIRWKVALGIEIEDRTLCQEYPLPRVRCRCSGRS